MAIHLTPTELAREAGLERREVIEKCMEMGVPIFQGRIDKTLFLANLRAGRDPPSAPSAYRPDACTARRGARALYESASSGSERRSNGEQHRGAGPAASTGPRRSPT